MRRSFKIGLYSLLGFFALVLVVVGGLFAYLNTESGARFALSKIQSYAAENYAVQIAYSKVSFSPFRHLHLENLKITRLQGEEKLEVTIDEVDARYAIFWLSRSVVIESVLVRKPAAFARMKTPAAPADPASAKSGGAPILSFPINLTLKRFELKDATWDVVMGDTIESSGSGSVDFAFEALRNGTVDVKPSHFQFRAKRIKTAAADVKDASLVAQTKLLFEDGTVKTVDASGEMKAPEITAPNARVSDTVATFKAAKQDKVRVEMRAESARVAAGPFATQPQRLLATASAVVESNLSGGDLQGTASLGGKEFLVYDAKAAANDAIHVDGNAKATLATPLVAILAPGLVKYGDLVAALKFKGTLQSPARSLADIDAERLKSSAATSEFHLDVAGTKLRPVTVDGTMKIDKGGTPIAFDPLILHYDGKALAKAKGAAVLSGATWNVDADVEASYGPELKGLVPAEQIAMMGAGTLKMKVKAASTPPTLVASTGTTTWTQTAPVAAGGHTVRVGEPAVVTHDVKYDGGKLDATLDGTIPAVKIDGLAEASATKFKAVAYADKLPEPSKAELTVTATQAKLKLESEMAKQGPPLEGLKMDLRAGVNGDKFTLQEFQASIGGSLVVFSAEGSGKMKRKDIQIRGRLAADMPKSFPPVAGNSVSGKVELPWTLTVIRGKEIDVSGEITLDKFNWAKGPQFARGISGSIPLSEEIILDKKGIRLAYVIAQNPFERVDFERIRPLITRAERVRIEEMGFEEKRYGPLIGFFSLRQNLLVAHQVDVDLRGAGLMYGEMYLDLHPQNRRLGFLTRLTALDLPKLMPKKYLPRMPDEDAKVSGRAGLVFNLTPGTVDGRLDITEIGAPQLTLLINAMDPEFENERMNMARKALGFGAPKFVQLAFQKGYADMALDISLLGTSQHFDVRGLSLSTWVSGATQQVAKQTEEVIQ